MSVRTPEQAREWTVVFVAVYEDPDAVAWTRGGRERVKKPHRPLPAREDGRGIRLAWRHLCGALFVPLPEIPSALPPPSCADCGVGADGFTAMEIAWFRA